MALDAFRRFGKFYDKSKDYQPLSGVMDAFDEEQKSNREIRDYNTKQEGDFGRSLRLERGKKKIETEADMEMLKTLGMGRDGGSSTGGFMPESYKVGNVTYKNPNYSGQLTASRNKGFLERKRMMGAGAQSTPINAAIQSAKSASNARNILFPDGTPKSFRADIATMKNKWLGRPTLSKDAQDLAREYGIALDLYNRQVTGAAFNQEEFKRRIDQFQVDLLSNPESAFNSLNRLEELSTDYLKIADPEGLFHGQGSSTDSIGNQDMTGNQEQDYDNYVQQLVDSGMDEGQALEIADQEFGL